MTQQIHEERQAAWNAAQGKWERKTKETREEAGGDEEEQVTAVT
jgi:hypothetical protein